MVCATKQPVVLSRVCGVGCAKYVLSPLALCSDDYFFGNTQATHTHTHTKSAETESERKNVRKQKHHFSVLYRQPKMEKWYK